MSKKSIDRAIIDELSGEIGYDISKERCKYDGENNVVSLNLSKLNLEEIPDTIWRLAKLISLDLSNNSIRQIPEGIKRLTELRVLVLRNNRLHDLHAEVFELSKLKKLILNGNNIKFLSPEIGLLSSLESLYVSRNHLSYLPSEIGQLLNLKSLYLTNNHLTSLPIEIGQLNSLQQLYLSRNRLLALPLEVGKLQALQLIELDDNPTLSSPPPEIIASGTAAILIYLQQLQEQGAIRHESKLLVVGEGGTGKTSLVRALRGEKFDSHSDTTHGIEIGSYQLQHPLNEEVQITLNTWDFGGQQIYHATHQFFLTKRSLYLVIWNSRLGAEQGRLNYWLDTINALAPDAPVLLIATHSDERAPDLNYQLYKDAYPQLAGSLAVSNKTGIGLDELKVELAKQATQLPLIGQLWPQKWIDAEQSLLTRSDHHIDADSYTRVCIENGVDEESALNTLAAYLHDLGKILYFNDDDVLCNIVILKPNWVTKAISRVLTDDKVSMAKGILNHSELSRVWAHDDGGRRYARYLYPLFLRLMERFDLSYQLGEPGERVTASLVPQLLPHQPPENPFSWTEQPPIGHVVVEMTYRLDFVPAGIMSWFIVRSHRYTTNLHWREGVVLQYEGHQARVELNPMLRELRLLVSGSLPQNFFTILMKTMDEILKRFEGLRIERRIPCICHRWRKSTERCHRFYHYEDLVRRMEKGKLEIECPDTFEEVSVPEMLYGIHTSTDQEVMRDIKRGQQELLVDFKSHQVLLQQINQRSELIGRNFTRLWNFEMKKMGVECPSTFFIMPDNGQPFDPRKLLSKAYRLYLVCQHPPEPHSVGDGYHLRQPNEWWVAMSPWLNYLLTFLKFAVPLGSKGFEAIASQAYVNDMKAGIDVLEEIVKSLPVPEVAHELQATAMEPRLGIDQQAVGPALRMLHTFLNEVDKSHLWGGLYDTPTPDGNILWLCATHRQQYEVKPLVLDKDTSI